MSKQSNLRQITTVIPLISTPGTYFLLKLEGATLIEGQCLKERGIHFKVQGIIHMKLQSLLHFSF